MRIALLEVKYIQSHIYPVCRDFAFLQKKKNGAGYPAPVESLEP